MKVIGEGKVYFYDPRDECPHAPEEGRLWQESFVLYLWDPERTVYVFLRLGQVPNKDGGQTTVWLNVWTPGQMYKFTDDAIPLSPSDRTENSLSSRGGLCSYRYDGRHNWQVNDGDHEVKVDLVMEDYHQGLGYWPETSGTLIENTAKNHIEATGWVTGTVSVQSKQYQVAGTGWRDHSWGNRDWLKIRAHRGYLAMFGRELNIFCFTYIGEDGHLVKNGLIIRGEEVQFTREFTVTAYMGEDAVSNCGGHVDVMLDGKMQRMEFIPQGKSALSMTHRFPCVDAMCLVKLGDMTGVGLAETSTRPQGGCEWPYVFESSPGVIDNGIFTG